MQMEALECGAACLAMVLAYYGRWVPLEKVRADCGVSRDGSKARNILRAARMYGLEAHGARSTAEALREEGTFPCIAHWNFRHFMVVDGFRGKYVYLNDPAGGTRKMPFKEFEEGFTGISLQFSLTDKFEKGGAKPDPVAYARTRLKGTGKTLVFVMLTAAISSLVAILNTSLGKVFMDRILTGENPDWLVPLTLIMLVAAIISGIVSILNAVYLVHMQGKIAVVSSSRFMRHLLHLPMGFYAQRMVGDLQQRQSANETIAFSLVGQIAPVLVNVVMLVLYLVIMLNYSVLLTVVGILTMLINSGLGRYISKKRINISRAAAASGGKFYATTVGGIELIETIKASGAESGYFGRWSGYQAEVNEASVRSTRLNSYLGIAPALVSSLANILVLVLGIWLIVEGRFTPGSLLAFTGFLGSFMAPVNQMISLGQTVQEMQTSMERIEDVMRYEADVPYEGAPGVEESLPTDLEAIEQFGRSKLFGKVDVEGLTFGYSPLEPPLIKDFNLHLERGEWVALVGGSGCGKSTIAKLISGLYVPWSGEIRFDDIPISEVPRAVLRSSVAVVDQDIVTFENSVIENIRLWDHAIEDFEAKLAGHDACIHDDIMAREGGYASQVLPDGRNFSGGQLQRLEIARALAQEPMVLVLDEATSALDTQTEAEIMARLRDRGITCIIVAHRLSTIRDCDEIVVIDDGVVVERGTHDELIAKDGAYAELVRSD